MAKTGRLLVLFLVAILVLGALFAYWTDGSGSGLGKIATFLFLLFVGGIGAAFRH